MAGIGRWLRDQRNEVVVDTIAKSADPTSMLTRLGNLVGDPVITGLLDRSEGAFEADQLQEALRYADLAVAASLVGGAASTRAEALAWRAGVLTRQDSRPKWITGGRLPEQAAVDLRAAILIYSRSRQLDAWKRFTDLYWMLPEHDAEPLSPDLAGAIESMLARIDDDQARAELLHVLGDVHQHQDADGAVVAAWSSAADTFRLLRDGKGEFIVRGKLFQYVALRGHDAAVDLGRACLDCAPPDVEPDVLANVYHVLAAALQYDDQIDEALTAYTRAIELLSQKPGVVVHDVQFESAMVMVTAHRYLEAIDRLRAALEGSGGVYVRWAAHMQLADLLATQVGDTGGAIEHVEEALQLAISMTKTPGLRVHSLHRSGLLHLSSNDFEIAYRRFTAALPLLEDRSLPIQIGVNRLYDHLVLPAPRAELFRLAAVTSHLTGRRDEAEALLAKAEALADEAPPQLTDLAGVADAELGDSTLMVGAEHLTVAAVLLHHAPDLALARLNQIPADIDPLLARRKAGFTAMCYRRLGDQPAAMAAYRTVLAITAPETDAEIVQLAHWQLAMFLLADREYEQAYPHLRACAQLFENSRASFAGVEQRMSFLGEPRLAIYERLVETCLITGRRVEAYEAVQRIKSRTLLDLIATDHRPIDHTLEKRAASLRADREDWVTEYISGTGPDDPPGDYLASREYMMLSSSITLHRTMDDVENERQAAGLFDRVRVEGRPLTYAEIRAFLNHAVSHRDSRG